jgi:hypothetical protein
VSAARVGEFAGARISPRLSMSAWQNISRRFTPFYSILYAQRRINLASLAISKRRARRLPFVSPKAKPREPLNPTGGFDAIAPLPSHGEDHECRRSY